MPVEDDLLLPEPQGLTRGQPNLLANEVDPGDGLGYRMLDLDAAVDLDEVEVALAVQQELERPDTLVAGGENGANRQVAESLASRLGHGRRRTLLDDLLVAPLDAAITLTKVNAVPVLVDQDLDLNVAALLDPFFEVDGVVTKGGLRLRAGQQQRGLHLPRGPNQAHAAAAAARRRLEQHRVACLLGLRQPVVEIADDPTAAGNRRQAVGGEHPAHGVLTCEALEHLRAGADEVQVVRGAHLRKAGVLRQEAVAGMHRVAAADQGGGDERGLVQVAAPRFGWSDADRLVGEAHGEGLAVSLRIGDDRRHAKVPARPQDAHRDLATVRDQNLAEHQADTCAGICAAACSAATVA